MPAFSCAASRPGAAKSKDEAEGEQAADRAGGNRARYQPGAEERAGGTAGDAGGADHGRVIRFRDRGRKAAADCVTAGYLAGRCVVLVWTPRGGARRVISMRHGHADEEATSFGDLDRS
jgi:hypothetical protein